MPRTFRRTINRYEDDGLDRLIDKRIAQVSHRRAPVDEVMRRVDRYRKRRERTPWPGMMRHQDGSQHQWVAGQYWDRIVTMDDATNEHYSMFFCDQDQPSLSAGTGASSMTFSANSLSERCAKITAYRLRG